MGASHEYRATVIWQRQPDEAFRDNRYHRGHDWHFDGGVIVPASSSPQVVPLPLSRAEAVDPEEAFVAALSSCHMLFFLSYTAQAGLVVERYEDPALGWMGRNEAGAIAMLKVALRPHIAWGGSPPAPGQVEALHERAHAACFIANSVRTEVVVEPAHRAVEAGDARRT